MELGGLFKIIGEIEKIYKTRNINLLRGIYIHNPLLITLFILLLLFNLNLPITINYIRRNRSI